MSKIAFIDLEASGLGPTSWPIEVGWCFADDDPHAFLISPAADWPLDAWSEEAEALHHVSYESLKKFGRAPREICQNLNAALSDAEVYSDAPDWDSFWLYRLFTAGGVKQSFKLHFFGDLLARIGGAELTQSIERARQIAPHRHRVRDDVLHMKTIFALINKAKQG